MKKFFRDTRIDADRFRAGMALLTGAVNIVATRNGEIRSGLTASAVCSFSADPPRLLACINFSGNSFQQIAESRCMSVNVLAQSQEQLAKRFANMLAGENEDRFGYGKWTELMTGAPVLEEALAAFDCSVEEMLVAHTHAVIIGEVKDVIVNGGMKPLLYSNRAFTTTKGAYDEFPLDYIMAEAWC
ncbi:flavin reductase family protein [Candidatus Rariloculus sp.]|uniref:flavin reductase family protein n=1 Tax=Candidatus Rariloculus sp. TaxID=3101265 RepID=UPI003D10F7A0